MVYYFKYKPTKQNEVKTVAIAMENKPAKAGYNTYGNQNDDDEQDDVYENPGEVNMWWMLFSDRSYKNIQH